MYREQYVKYSSVARVGQGRRKRRKREREREFLWEEIEGHRTYGERTGNSFSNGRPYNCECSSRFNRQMGLDKNHVISVIVSRTTSTIASLPIHVNWNHKCIECRSWSPENRRHIANSTHTRSTFYLRQTTIFFLLHLSSWSILYDTYEQYLYIPYLFSNGAFHFSFFVFLFSSGSYISFSQYQFFVVIRTY